jgi:hypothetical protein
VSKSLNADDDYGALFLDPETNVAFGDKGERVDWRILFEVVRDREFRRRQSAGESSGAPLGKTFLGACECEASEAEAGSD